MRVSFFFPIILKKNIWCNRFLGDHRSHQHRLNLDWKMLLETWSPFLLCPDWIRIVLVLFRLKTAGLLFGFRKYLSLRHPDAFVKTILNRRKDKIYDRLTQAIAIGGFAFCVPHNFVTSFTYYFCFWSYRTLSLYINHWEKCKNTEDQKTSWSSQIIFHHFMLTQYNEWYGI